MSICGRHTSKRRKPVDSANTIRLPVIVSLVEDVTHDADRLGTALEFAEAAQSHSIPQDAAWKPLQEFVHKLPRKPSPSDLINALAANIQARGGEYLKSIILEAFAASSAEYTKRLYPVGLARPGGQEAINATAHKHTSQHRGTVAQAHREHALHHTSAPPKPTIQSSTKLIPSASSDKLDTLQEEASLRSDSSGQAAQTDAPLSGWETEVEVSSGAFGEPQESSASMSTAQHPDIFVTAVMGLNIAPKTAKGYAKHRTKGMSGLARKTQKHRIRASKPNSSQPTSVEDWQVLMEQQLMEQVELATTMERQTKPSGRRSKIITVSEDLKGELQEVFEEVRGVYQQHDADVDSRSSTIRSKQLMDEPFSALRAKSRMRSTPDSDFDSFTDGRLGSVLSVGAESFVVPRLMSRLPPNATRFQRDMFRLDQEEREARLLAARASNPHARAPSRMYVDSAVGRSDSSLTLSHSGDSWSRTRLNSVDDQPPRTRVHSAVHSAGSTPHRSRLQSASGAPDTLPSRGAQGSFHPQDYAASSGHSMHSTPPADMLVRNKVHEANSRMQKPSMPSLPSVPSTPNTPSTPYEDLPFRAEEDEGPISHCTSSQTLQQATAEKFQHAVAGLSREPSASMATIQPVLSQDLSHFSIPEADEQHHSRTAASVMLQDVELQQGISSTAWTSQHGIITHKTSVPSGSILMDDALPATTMLPPHASAPASTHDLHTRLQQEEEEANIYGPQTIPPPDHQPLETSIVDVRNQHAITHMPGSQERETSSSHSLHPGSESHTSADVYPHHTPQARSSQFITYASGSIGAPLTVQESNVTAPATAASMAESACIVQVPVLHPASSSSFMDYHNNTEQETAGKAGEISRHEDQRAQHASILRAPSLLASGAVQPHSLPLPTQAEDSAINAQLKNLQGRQPSLAEQPYGETAAPYMAAYQQGAYEPALDAGVMPPLEQAVQSEVPVTQTPIKTSGIPYTVVTTLGKYLPPQLDDVPEDNEEDSNQRLEHIASAERAMRARQGQGVLPRLPSIKPSSHLSADITADGKALSPGKAAALQKKQQLYQPAPAVQSPKSGPASPVRQKTAPMRAVSNKQPAASVAATNVVAATYVGPAIVQDIFQ